jgi:hypothetical protein
MNDLLNLASKTMEGFNPATDSVDNFEEIADGVYNCVLDDVTARKNDKGTNWISFKFSILEGDYANRIIFVNYFFTEKMAERSIKGIIKLAYDFGYELPLETFTTYESIAETLKGMAGNTATVTKTTSKNNFANYTVTPVE